MKNNIKNNSKFVCDACCSTGIIRAALVKKDVEGTLFQDHIDVVLCGGDHDISLGEKASASMEKLSSLPVNIVGVEKPSYQEQKVS